MAIQRIFSTTASAASHMLVDEAVNDNVEVQRAERKISESSDPYEAYGSDDEQQKSTIQAEYMGTSQHKQPQSPTDNDGQIVTKELDTLYSTPTSSYDQGTSGYLTKQGWHSFNDPNNPQPTVLVSNDTNSEIDQESYDPEQLFDAYGAKYQTNMTKSPILLDMEGTGSSDSIDDEDIIESNIQEELYETIRGREVDKIQEHEPAAATQENPNFFSHPVVGTLNSGEDDSEIDEDVAEGKWDLIGDDTSSPKVGIPAPNKLKIHLIHKTSKEETISFFKKIENDEIDWSNNVHIQAISTWRRQYFRRKAFPKTKTNVIYEPDEEAFLLLMHHKIKATAAGPASIQAPGPALILKAFNSFFASKIIKDKHGKSLPPRAPRDEKSFSAKLNRTSTALFKLREEIKTILQGKTGGEVFVPVITEDEIRQYREHRTAVEDEIFHENNASLSKQLAKKLQEEADV
ncbi:hypothetical protein K505DRAFT_363366 [Melanomma pulvis-pyrius CBS 109.77]|uniref:Uncharacterized protein n=1 Tax=Melanomma pulvis-pyrius CBS 109.77 TaxID=1314802 RepID=A0A6A6X703_9PLEO|nr:hypothetical protein K505DRAFT_363366 [Melanomma pulvis-pyrius CBS 109.77]